MIASISPYCPTDPHLLSRPRNTNRVIVTHKALATGNPVALKASASIDMIPVQLKSKNEHPDPQSLAPDMVRCPASSLCHVHSPHEKSSVSDSSVGTCIAQEVNSNFAAQPRIAGSGGEEGTGDQQSLPP